MSAPDPGPLPSLAPLAVTAIATAVLPMIAVLAYGSTEMAVTAAVTFAVSLWVRRQTRKRCNQWKLRAAAYIRCAVDECRMHPNALEMAERFEQEAGKQ